MCRWSVALTAARVTSRRKLSMRPSAQSFSEEFRYATDCFGSVFRLERARRKRRKDLRIRSRFCEMASGGRWLCCGGAGDGEGGGGEDAGGVVEGEEGRVCRSW